MNKEEYWQPNTWHNSMFWKSVKLSVNDERCTRYKEHITVKKEQCIWYKKQTQCLQMKNKVTEIKREIHGVDKHQIRQLQLKKAVVNQNRQKTSESKQNDQREAQHERPHRSSRKRKERVLVRRYLNILRQEICIMDTHQSSERWSTPSVEQDKWKETPCLNYQRQGKNL